MFLFGGVNYANVGMCVNFGGFDEWCTVKKFGQANGGLTICLL